MYENQTGFRCEVCGNTFVGQWTDFYGEATCTNCGAPYQILEPYGAELGKAYPHINVDTKMIPILKEYWEETHDTHREGMFVGSYGQMPAQRRFRDWVRRNHPEAVKEMK